MDFGIICLSTVASRKDVAFAEANGFTHAWLADSQMVWADPYQCLALCATLNMLAPGRVIMGIGTGNTSRRTLGMPAARLADLRTYIETCRGLWKRETVHYQEADRRRQIRFLNPDVGFINLRDSIPVYLAGSGPKSLELAGEIGDGVILFGVVGDSLLEYTLGHLRRGAERAGKRLQDLYIVVTTIFHLSKSGESFADVQRAVGPLVTSECNIFALSVKDPGELPADIRSDLMAFESAYRTPNTPIERRHLDLYSGYCEDFKPEHAPLVTERIIRQTTLAGSAEELQVRIRKMAAAGVNQIAIAGDQTMIGEFKTHVIEQLT
jgi:5,10-methylenetetrahydromethanopterin reductase